MTSKRSINDSWEQILAEDDIPAQIAARGSYEITADRINRVREARLMAKFDESRSVPLCLQRHRINILPTSRGTYILGPFETFAPVDYPRQHPLPIQIPPLDTLDAGSLQSEAEALLFLSNSEILQTVFGSTRIHTTMSGRRASGEFAFTINDRTHARRGMRVKNAQLEIDAGYETPDTVFVCEAKNRHVTDMNVRQLYYPYRFAQMRTKKPVIPVSIIFSNQTFYITRYTFTEPAHYNSLVVDQRFCFTLAQKKVDARELRAAYYALHTPAPAAYAHIPFPQADNITLVTRLCEALKERPFTTADVTAFLGYAERQSGYYTNAARSLGLLEKTHRAGKTVFQLTQHGHVVMHSPPHVQRAACIKAMMRIPCFYELFPTLLRTRHAPSLDEIVSVMQQHAFLKLNTEVTIHRRAQTVLQWLRWVVQAIDVWDT